MKRKPQRNAHGPLPEEPWDVATFRRYEHHFPRWRTEGKALCDQYDADLIERACIFILNERAWEAVREWVRYGDGAGVARRRRLLPRGKGRPEKPVVRLLCEGGLRPAAARSVAGVLAAIVSGDRDVALQRRALERERWRRMVDSLIAAQQALKAQGLKRPHADQFALERGWRKQLQENAWHGLFTWSDIQTHGLNRLSVSMLQRHRNKPLRRK